MLILALMHTAQAEEQLILDSIDLNALKDYSAEQGVDIMRWTLSALSGDVDFTDDFSSLLNQCRSALFGELTDVVTAVLVPATVLLVLRLLLPASSSTQRIAALVCRLSCIASLSAVFIRMQTVASSLLHEFVMLSDVLTPALITATALSGAESAAALLSPMTALCADMIQNLLTTWGIAVSSASAGIAAAGNMSGSIRLKRLHALLKRLLHWGTGGLLAAFTAILSLQGKLSAGRDSAASRTAKYAIENLIPVIGGNVSDSLDSLLCAASVVKNALGTSGLMLTVCVCITPIARLLGLTILLHLTSAISEPLGDDLLTAFAGQFADSIEMLLIICVTAAVLFGLLIGSCMSAASGMIR